MKVILQLYKNQTFEPYSGSDAADPVKVQLVMGFGAKHILASEPIYDQLKSQYPSAHIVLCSTAGEIYNNTVQDNTVSVAAVQFEKSTVKACSVNIDAYPGSYEAGIAIVNDIEFEDLASIIIISDGSKVNGSELVRGINEKVKHRVPVTGGLAGDADKFESTLVGLDGVPSGGKIVAIALYGKHLKISHGSMGGWDMFGPERTVTSSESNILYEIDQKNALDLYTMYLGDYADKLPGSALLFPLSVKLPGASEPVVRTILSIDNQSRSMVFAGDVPEGAQVRFMKANFDRLIDAATHAASQTLSDTIVNSPKLALLISCVGRKIILDHRTEEEVEAIFDTFGQKTFLTGFYSYGEISPLAPNAKCDLHNQTMTITTFDEQ